MTHVVRVAQEGWDRSEPARSVEETRVGIQVPWVEIDGHRLDASFVSGVELVMDAGFALPKIALLARVEIVYVDADGKPLPLRKRRRARKAAKRAGR